MPNIDDLQSEKPARIEIDIDKLQQLRSEYPRPPRHGFKKKFKFYRVVIGVIVVVIGANLKSKENFTFFVT